MTGKRIQLREIAGWLQWTELRSGAPMRGEAGVLKKVYWNKTRRIVEVFIEQKGMQYLGELRGNSFLLGQVLALLLKKVGRPVEEIAALEIELDAW
jgi:hypothetical protein